MFKNLLLWSALAVACLVPLNARAQPACGPTQPVRVKACYQEVCVIAAASCRFGFTPGGQVCGKGGMMAEAMCLNRYTSCTTSWGF